MVVFVDGALPEKRGGGSCTGREAGAGERGGRVDMGGKGKIEWEENGREGGSD